ncbi:zinc finger protein-like [Tropilaelaps mercedesae]|uniref:Zinc finger protein-like n=1 Tax=Tropilaelaps mercedesae TaxID=418985 RepID=A0A1V9X8P6_9ACAR|nr:zinc finger protein-like [Tropilaelaps mercedesae]
MQNSVGEYTRSNEDQGKQAEISQVQNARSQAQVEMSRHETDSSNVQQSNESMRKPDESVNFEEDCSLLQSGRCVVTAQSESGQQLMLLEQLHGTDGTPGVRQEYVLLFQEGAGAEPLEAYVVEGELDPGAFSDKMEVAESKTSAPCGETDDEPVEDTDSKPLAVRIDGRVHFRCDECDYVSRRRNYIKVHKQKVHVAPRALPCHVCQSTFLSTVALYAHMAEVHSAELPYSCDQCGYRARARHRIASHRLSHDKEPRYKCGKCGFATRHKYLYTQHEFTHQEPLPFSCSLCDYKAKWRSSVYMHIKKRHGQRLAGDEPWPEENHEEAS